MLEPEPLPEPLERVGTFSGGIARSRTIRTLLGADAIVHNPDPRSARNLDAIVGWGARATSFAGAKFAHEHGLPFLRLEDGFIRSVELGGNSRSPLSILVDDVGIYYDATRPSRLENLLQTGPLLPAVALEARAQRCIQQIVAHRISKYNHAPLEGQVFSGQGPRVLVIDQTQGDLSVVLGLADAARFGAMLEAALDENPGAEVVVKTHPDVIAGKRAGFLLSHSSARHARVWASDLNPITVMEQADRVYAVTSQMGFEALMLGKQVTLFGAPFYAGWGATDDRVPVPRRTARRTTVQIFAAAYFAYARYMDPRSQLRCEAEQLIDHIVRVSSESASELAPGFRRLEALMDFAPTRLARRQAVSARSGAKGDRTSAVSRARTHGSHDRDPQSRTSAMDQAPHASAARDLPSLVSAAERALSLGGFETALRLAAQVVETHASQVTPFTARATGILRQLQRVYGDDAALHALRDELRRLPAHHPLHAVGLTPDGAASAQAWLPLFDLDNRRRLGALSLDDCSAELMRRLPRSALLPDVQLLIANAAGLDRPAVLERAVNRYLDSFRLPSVQISPSGGVLGRFAFAASRPSRKGGSVSVLMSAFNASATVGDAIRSCLGQTHQNLELLVCDDASTDDTWDVLRDEFQTNPQVRLFRSEANQGSYNARNALLRYAAGDLIAFHDADDLALPCRIESQLRRLRASGAEACVADGVRVRPDATFTFFWDHRATRMATVSTIVRRTVLTRVPHFRSARIGADDEFLADIAQEFGRGAVTRLRTPLFFCLWPADSLTRAPQTCALETGYKSELRRRYSELVFTKRVHGRSVNDSETDDLLGRMGNLAEAAPIVPARD